MPTKMKSEEPKEVPIEEPQTDDTNQGDDGDAKSEDETHDDDGAPKTDNNKKTSKQGKKKKVDPARLNKLYRTPPTPTMEEAVVRERSFILDSRAVANVQDEYFRCKPKLGAVLPPFNSQNDSLSRRYFQIPGVSRILSSTGQNNGGTSIAGAYVDSGLINSNGARYLAARNATGGCGHSLEVAGGHDSWATRNPTKQLLGYNGYFGYRRNTPSLRAMPSSFGPGNRSLTSLILPSI